MENPYLDAFEELQEKDTFRGQQWFGERRDLVEQYAWAVPNAEVLAYLSEFGHMYEVGAGSGYWANCIEEAGGDVTPFDADPPDETWTDVDEATVSDYAQEIVEKPVLMVWPPCGEDMAWKVLGRRPSHVLYVGEQKGGCTGDDHFFDLLEKEYGLVARIEIPSYVGIHDDFYHYIRKV